MARSWYRSARCIMDSFVTMGCLLTRRPMTDHAHHDHHHTHEDQAEPADYRTWVKSQRLSKDDYFKRSSSSPIPAPGAGRASAGSTTTP